LLKKTSK